MLVVTAGDGTGGENSTQPRARVRREMALSVQLVCGFRNLATLVAGSLELVRGRQPRAIAACDRYAVLSLATPPERKTVLQDP